MGERIDIDGVRFKVDADLSKLKEGLKEGEKAGKEAGQKTGSGFSQAFNAVAGAAIAAGLKGFLSNAANQFKQIESAMLRVDSIAKGFGRSISEARSQVQQLADKGFLNLQQSASAYADAIALGFDEKQARKFIDALSDVAAFQNTIGDGAAAVQSGVSGLLSNSAEKVENIGVPIKLLNQEYQKNIATMGKAAAIQKFYNGVLAESSKFSGDAIKATQTLAGMQQGYETATAKAAATVGKKLEPALKSLYEIGTKIANWLADTIDKLDSTTVAVVAFGTLAFTSISAFAKGAALLPGLFGSIGASATAALGPIGVIIAALGVAFIAYKKWDDAYGKTRGQDMMEERKALQDIAAKQGLTITQKEKLKQLNAEIANSYAATLKMLGYENAALEDQLRLVGAIDREKKKAAAGGRTAAMSKAELEERISGRKAVLSGFSSTDFSKMTASQAAERLAQIKAMSDALAEDEAALSVYKEDPSGMKPTAGGTSGKGGPEFRFIKARDELKKLADEYAKYISKVGRDSEKGNEATEKFGIEAEAIKTNLRGAIAEYNEERTMAAIEAENAAYDQARANIYELANAEKLEKQDVEDRLQKLRESHARRTAEIQAESFARTMQGASALAGGIGQLSRARSVSDALGGAGGAMQGFSNFSDKFKSFGLVGQGVAAAAGVASFIQGFFEESEEKRAKDAEAQKRRDEEAKKILELQANYQKNMLALQEAAAKLPFADLQRNLRLADIEAQQRKIAGEAPDVVDADTRAKKLSLAQSTLAGQSGKIGEGKIFSGAGTTPDELIAFLSARAAQQVAVAQFMALLDLVASNTVSWEAYQTIRAQLRSYKGKIPDELFNAAVGSFVNHDGTTQLMSDNDIGYGGQRWVYDKGRLIENTVLGSAAKIGAARDIASEIAVDTGIAEDLLSVIEQSLQTQLEIAGNTKRTADKLSETPTRQSSIIDIARGYSRSLGAVLSPSLTNTGLPQSIAAAVLATDIQKSIQERSVKGIEDLVVIQRDSRELLAIIGKSLNSGTNANSSLLVQLEDLYRRSLAA